MTEHSWHSYLPTNDCCRITSFLFICFIKLWQLQKSKELLEKLIAAQLFNILLTAHEVRLFIHFQTRLLSWISCKFLKNHFSYVRQGYPSAYSFAFTVLEFFKWISSPSHACYMPLPSFTLYHRYHPKVFDGVELLGLIITPFSLYSFPSPSLRFRHSPSTPFSNADLARLHNWSKERAKNRVMKTNLIHYLSSIHFVSQTLHVSGILVAHHQEVYCVYTTVGTCCIYI
jgi:hypothetical protein